MILRILLFFIAILSVFVHFYFGLRHQIPQQSLGTYNAVWSVIVAIFVGGMLLMTFFFRRGVGEQPLYVTIILVTNFLIVIPMFIMSMMLLSIDFGRLIYSGILYFSSNRSVFPLVSVSSIFYKTVVYTGLLFGLLILYGATVGKYWFKVREVNLYFKDLPSQFEGFKIVHISDIHTGSFDYKKGVENGISLVNEQNPDIIAFSGDLVNSRASEAVPYIPMFRKLTAKYGKYAVMGNHDYAMYGNFDSLFKVENRNQLIKIHKDMGFISLNNESVEISKKGASLFITGVENWGLPPFPAFGDLDAAFSVVPKESFKILLSHDPSHWDEQIVHFDKNVQITLSGHTHGMQFGIDLPWFKLSPVSLKYPKWAGLFETDGKYMYVNRGFGFIGYPGRVGIRPEITVIKLHVAQ